MKQWHQHVPFSFPLVQFGLLWIQRRAFLLGYSWWAIRKLVLHFHLRFLQSLWHLQFRGLPWIWREHQWSWFHWKDRHQCQRQWIGPIPSWLISRRPRKSRCLTWTQYQFSGFVNVAGHDSDFAFIGLNDSRAVGANHSAHWLRTEGVLHFDHVVLGNSIRDGHNQFDFSFDCFHNCICCCGGRNVDNWGVAACCLFCLSAIFEHWKA